MTTQEELAPAIPQVPVGPGGRDALIGRRVFPSPLMRRITYAVVFEILAVGFTTLILALLGNDSGSSFLVGLVSSTVALTWNLIFNWGFEAFERRIKITHRPWYMRVTHAVLFEGGLVAMLVPAIAWILGVSLLEAFILEIGLLIFFLIYTAIYAWAFDRVFGLPEPRSHYGR
ncbi:PACE efflux transporter [Enteractinococcus coprophilus]|uniref:Putative membrane protein n=1 Tax=Enteractinococcus coprophilus TaxID=1027633 RepID=A0A543A073_9MICC|nr:PACE efflux transporter [Enteractinococcus coprophilus]TQL65985.1 putative membrane protein [Enteractinococcus coprophilus]